jgi:hypothetical protein
MTVPTNSQEAKGFPCPQCRALIQVPLARLIAMQPIYCAACGLKLEIAPGPSQSAVAAARSLSDAMAKIPKR